MFVLSALSTSCQVCSLQPGQPRHRLLVPSNYEAVHSNNTAPEFDMVAGYHALLDLIQGVLCTPEKIRCSILENFKYTS